MYHTLSLGALFGLLELAVPFYGFRLARRFGIKQVGWSLVAAFSCLAAVRAFGSGTGTTNTQEDLTRLVIYALVPLMLLIGMAHIDAVCREKVRADAAVRARESAQTERLTAGKETQLQVMAQVALASAQHFNRHLAVIGLYARILVHKRFGLQTAEYHKRIAEETERAARLGKELLSIATTQRHRLQPVSLIRLTLDIVSELQSKLGPEVVLETKCGQQLPPVLADPEQFCFMLEQLVKNAVEASRPGGRVSILADISDGLPSNEHCQIPKVRRFVRITVADSGHGMDANVREHLFEPFFTTKDRSRHAGLGLAIVYALAKQHGGGVDVQSRMGRGTRVQVFFPVAF